MNKYYKIDCEWCTENGQPDAAGDSKNSWSGLLVFEDNGHIYGAVKDFGAEQTTHYVAGSYDPKIGITLVKYNILNMNYDPIGFSGIITDNKNEYVGDFSAITPFNCYPMGCCKITTKEATITVEDLANIQNAATISRSNNFYLNLEENLLDHEKNIQKLKYILKIKKEYFAENLYTR